MKRFFAIALILGAFVTLLGLGTWQVQRLAWKEALIAEAEMRPTLPAVPLHTLLEDGSDDLAYRRADVTGRFFGEAVRVFTTLSDPVGPYEGPGYWLMHPFEIAATGQTVFANRGFIPFEMPPGTSVRPAPAGTIRFEGLLRPDDVADWATPDPDYEDGILYRRDVDQLRQAADLTAALPITIDMPASVMTGLPQAGETKFIFSNRHFEYALTWYALALALAVIVGFRLVQGRRSGH